MIDVTLNKRVHFWEEKMSKLDNYIESKRRELNLPEFYQNEYTKIYTGFEDLKLRGIFSYLHERYVESFEKMNQRLPTSDATAHFWAEESRDLLSAIETTCELRDKLKQTKFAFEIDPDYVSVIEMCKSFLLQYNGSTIPIGIEKIEVYYTIPIFISADTIILSDRGQDHYEKLKLIGNGSYAKVFKFKDPFYKKTYALKRANKNLDEKEMKRFRQEFEQMKNLNSPYIVEVYSFDEQKNEYIMEYLDCTLEKYIQQNNTRLSLDERKRIIAQLLKGFEYLHSKGIYHRDVSTKNILVKQYDNDLNIFKIADFGLLKIANSELISLHSEVKGSLNDPLLKIYGFGSYGLLNEIYALTQLFVYVLTGKTKLDTIKDAAIKEFIEKGMHANLEQRFQNLDELQAGMYICIEKLR